MNYQKIMVLRIRFNDPLSASLPIYLKVMTLKQISKLYDTSILLKDLQLNY